MEGEMRVLHVDDDPDFAEVVATSLERENERFTVETVTSASEGLDRLGDDGFDCIVSDHDMPDQNGIEFLEAVREEYPDLPFILFTGKGSEEVASEAISAGVTDYLQKSPDSSQYAVLANRIRNAVEQYRSRRAADETKRKLSLLAEKTDDVLFMFDGDWSELLFINSAYEDVWGGSITELEEDPDSFLEYVHPEDRKAAIRSMERLSNGEPDTIEYRVVPPDGERRWVRGESKPILDDDGNVARIVGFVRDITEHKERQRELREKSNLLDQIFEQVPTHLYVMDEQARLLRVSEYYVDDPDARTGKTDREISPGEFGEAAHADNVAVIETGEPIINKEEYLSSRDRWGLTSKVPWYDEEGDIAGLLGVTRDITKRKEYEQELESQNERLDEFASIVSHDLRNPLNVAEGRLELARAECETEHLDAVADAHDRMETLIADLLALARYGRDVTETEPVDLAECSRGCWQNVDAPGATFVSGTDRTIRADRGRLKQLLENLMRNAVEHGGGDVTVRVGEVDDGFYVEDDGPGIPAEKRERIFEAGYSTTAEGTGFGLSIVTEVAEAHGWEVRVTEGRDGGARFEITGTDVEP